jgi:transcriptional regulator with XRE-family HTH domain
MYPNLKLQLWRTGLRQNRLARILNMDETLLSRIMNGFRQPTDELKGRIAEVLQSDKEWLFEADYNGLEGVSQARSQQSGK